MLVRLPLAHPVAPTPASAVLWGAGIMLLRLMATFYGVIIGPTQGEPKALLAYSSISQMGIMTMATGLGLMLPDKWPVIRP